MIQIGFDETALLLHGSRGENLEGKKMLNWPRRCNVP